ncbi:MAG: sulfurtransferase TusA family protein [Pirellula sp.]
MPNQELDCVGLHCPVPIVRVSRTMKDLRVGDQLTVSASDPSFQADIEAWVRTMGHRMVSFREASGIQTAIVEKCN